MGRACHLRLKFSLPPLHSKQASFAGDGIALRDKRSTMKLHVGRSVTPQQVTRCIEMLPITPHSALETITPQRVRGKTSDTLCGSVADYPSFSTGNKQGCQSLKIPLLLPSLVQIHHEAAMLNGQLHHNEDEGKRVTHCVEVLPIISHSTLKTNEVVKP
ncbi:hypothetical protein TNCV_3402371 [Trichonephila clavipes]|nr:hypothetical protein TNCV_3402371 [Trichonephila clavipes]